MRDVLDQPQAERVIDALRGGRNNFLADREAAAEIVESVRGARRAVTWADRFHGYAAQLAVTAGLEAVVFGDVGYPAGTPLHWAAAAASDTAWFGYADRGSVASLRCWDLGGDSRARAFRAAVADPEELLKAARSAGLGDGPVQVHWGLAAVCAMGAARAAELAGQYAQFLPPGSQLAMSVLEPGGIGDALADMAGGQAHTAADAVRWLEGGGMTVRVAEVRAWGREALAAALPPRAGRIMGLVATKGPDQLEPPT